MTKLVWVGVLTLLFYVMLGCLAHEMGEDARMNAERIEQVRKEASFWRKMYLQADADAKTVNCEPLDNNYFICEKAKTP